jgi:hypothetical protein
MARIYLMDIPQQPVILSVEDAVGPDAPNRRVDVLLVQFFLHVTAQTNEQSWGWLIDRAVARPAIDGVYGPVTQGWIDRFQNHTKRLRIVADGRVDAIKNGVSSTPDRGPLTIYLLNVAYYGSFGPDAISRIGHHPLMPWELARTFVMHGWGYDPLKHAG